MKNFTVALLIFLSTIGAAFARKSHCELRLSTLIPIEIQQLKMKIADPRERADLMDQLLKEAYKLREREDFIFENPRLLLAEREEARQAAVDASGPGWYQRVEKLLAESHEQARDFESLENEEKKLLKSWLDFMNYELKRSAYERSRDRMRLEIVSRAYQLSLLSFRRGMDPATIREIRAKVESLQEEFEDSRNEFRLNQQRLKSLAAVFSSFAEVEFPKYEQLDELLKDEQVNFGWITDKI